MVPLTALWLPIVLAAVAVFVVSSIIHMVFKYHHKEYRKLPTEEGLLEAIRTEKVHPGFYSFPHAARAKDMGSDEMQAKFKKGPVGTMNIQQNGSPAMGKFLGMWFAYSLLVGLFAAYVTGRTLPPGTPYLAVFRIVGASSFMAYSFAHLSDGIWIQKPWTMTLKHVFDGLIYAMVTAGVFGWLWP